MRRRMSWLGLLGLLGLVGVLGVVAGSAAGTPPSLAWNHAIETPGTAALNSGGNASVFALSCGAPRNCAAGGFYKDGSGHSQAFIASEKNGSWGDAVEVPGTAALNAGGSAIVVSASCGAPRSCAAGGYYKDGSGNLQAFVVDEKNGVWGDAIEVPGTAALNSGGHANLASISCSSAGSCTAGGYYSDGSSFQAFVVRETNGVWGNATEVPGSAVLFTDGALLNAVSCATAGSCVAGGYYWDGSSNPQAFVVELKNGSWGHAVEVPGTANLNTDGDASVDDLSCTAPGSCSAGGFYSNGSGREGFVVSETKGHWGKAVAVPGLAALNKDGFARVYTLSCATAGSCGAGGIYKDGSGNYQAYLVSKTSGKWRTAMEVPGTAHLNQGASAGFEAVSCPAVGACVGGGVYKDGSGHIQPFVISEMNGRWDRAIELPGNAALNAGGSAGVDAISCAAAGSCAAGGGYEDGSAMYQAFVADSNPLCVVPRVVGKTLSAAKNALKAADCRLGKTTKVYSKLKSGRVVSEKPKAGTQLKAGAKVALNVSKGQKK